MTHWGKGVLEAAEGFEDHKGGGGDTEQRHHDRALDRTLAWVENPLLGINRLVVVERPTILKHRHVPIQFLGC